VSCLTGLKAAFSACACSVLEVRLVCPPAHLVSHHTFQSVLRVSSSSFVLFPSTAPSPIQCLRFLLHDSQRGLVLVLHALVSGTLGQYSQPDIAIESPSGASPRRRFTFFVYTKVQLTGSSRPCVVSPFFILEAARSEYSHSFTHPQV